MSTTLKKYAVFFLCVSLFCVARVSLAATGFVDSPLWLTPESPKEGDMVMLSAVFRNTETDTLSGTVVFYDADVLLGKKTITIASGGVASASITFKIGVGDHAFSAAMTNVTKVTSAGASTPYQMPIEKAELPKQFVAKKITTTSSETTSTDFSAPIMEKVNAVQDTALAAVPVSVKQSVSSTAGKVDAWRAKDAVVFAKNREAAKKTLDAGKGKTKTLTSDDGPLVYVQLVWFTIVAFLFASPYAFYGLGAFLLFLILRFLYRKIRGR